MLPTLELRIPISPNDKYMRMLHYFVESLKTFGGDIGRNAHCLVVVGEDAEPWDLTEQYPWTKDYSLEFIWVEREVFRKDTYDATGYVRLWHDTNADVIGLVDADLLFAGNFDEIVIEAYEKQCVLGFLAHMTPFREAELAELSSEECWERVFASAGLPKPELNWQYSAWGYMDTNPKQRSCPAYFNYGVILMPRRLLQQMAESYVTEIGHVDSVFNSVFKSQIANTLVFARYDMPCATLSINYNYPLNLPEQPMREINPDAKGRNSAEDIKIFHYLASGEINKRHFATAGTVTTLLQRQDLSPPGQVFQRCLQELHDKIEVNYPNSATVFNPLKGVISTEIIICGGRRSGTTLLAAMLSSDVRTNPLAAEAQIVTRLVETYRWGRKNFATMIVGSFFDTEKQFVRFYQELLNRLVGEVTARVAPGGVLILKNPEFSLVLIELLTLFKHALFFVTVRDPRDYVASEIEVERRRLADQGLDPDGVTRDIAKFAQRYMDYLRQLIKLLSKSQTPERLHVVCYEDMVLSPEKTLRRLSMVTGLQLQFDPAQPWQRVSDYAGLDTTPSRSDLYGKPIQTSQVGRYRHDLSADEIRVVEKICAQMMHCFGYKPDTSNH